MNTIENRHVRSSESRGISQPLPERAGAAHSFEAKQKDLSIETLRGLAIILMVAGHVIGDAPTNGMRASDTSGFHHAYYSLKFFRLPLFTVISGFVYALRPVVSGRSLIFLRGKARRILLPMAAVGTLEFFLRLIVPGTNSSVELSQIWRIYVYPFATISGFCSRSSSCSSRSPRLSVESCLRPLFVGPLCWPWPHSWHGDHPTSRPATYFLW